MTRPVTLFTGQWADLPLEDVARKASEFGYQGLELACWGDHFEVDKAIAEDNYCDEKRELLDRYDLQCHAISTHLVGQAVCDIIDQRHQAILPEYVWGDGGFVIVKNKKQIEVYNQNQLTNIREIMLKLGNLHSMITTNTSNTKETKSAAASEQATQPVSHPAIQPARANQPASQPKT